MNNCINRKKQPKNVITHVTDKRQLLNFTQNEQVMSQILPCWLYEVISERWVRWVSTQYGRRAPGGSVWVLQNRSVCVCADVIYRADIGRLFLPNLWLSESVCVFECVCSNTQHSPPRIPQGWKQEADVQQPIPMRLVIWLLQSERQLSV